MKHVDICLGCLGDQVVEHLDGDSMAHTDCAVSSRLTVRPCPLCLDTVNLDFEIPDETLAPFPSLVHEPLDDRPRDHYDAAVNFPRRFGSDRLFGFFTRAERPNPSRAELEHGWADTRFGSHYG